MTKAQEARLTALRRIQTYLDDNAVALGTVSKSTSRTDLDAAVTGLSQLAAQKDQADAEKTSRTKEKVAAREALRLLHMQPIAAIARKKLGNTPAIVDLRLPAKSTSDEALVAKGTAMAAAAARYPQTFIDQQMPADFLAQLQAAVATVQAAITARTSAALKANQATKGVKDQLAVTHTDVKVLNGLVVKQLHGNKGLLGAWTNAKRVHQKTGVATGSAKVPASVPATVPAAPVVSVTQATAGEAPIAKAA